MIKPQGYATLKEESVRAEVCAMYVFYSHEEFSLLIQDDNL